MPSVQPTQQLLKHTFPKGLYLSFAPFTPIYTDMLYLQLVTLKEIKKISCLYGNDLQRFAINYQTNMRIGSLPTLRQPKCEIHEKSIQYFCPHPLCQYEAVVCFRCFPYHQDHPASLQPFRGLQSYIRGIIQEGVKFQLESCKSNDRMIHELHAYKKCLETGEKNVFEKLWGLLDEEQERIMGKVWSEIEEERRVIAYVESMCNLGLINVRVKVSCEKGVKALEDTLKRYLQIKDKRSNHKAYIQTVVRKALEGTLFSKIEKLLDNKKYLLAQNKINEKILNPPLSQNPQYNRYLPSKTPQKQLIKYY